MNTHRTILIVDPTNGFVDLLKQDPLFKSHPFVHVNNGKDAQDVLTKKNFRFSGVFISPALKEAPNWISVIKCVHLNHHLTPIFLFGGNEKPKQLTDLDLKKMGIHSEISREISYADMIKLVYPVLVSLGDIQKKVTPAQDEKIEIEGYIGIRAMDFVSGTISPFDIFLRLSSTKYLKILYANDLFDPHRVESFIKKGVEYFFIQKCDHESYVQYCDQVAKVIIQKESIPQNIKIIQTLNHGEQVLNHFKSFGMTKQNFDFAKAYANNMNSLAGQLTKNTSSKMIKSFLNNSMAYDHGVGTSMLAGLMTKNFGISSNTTFQVVGLGALFHDMALTSEDKKFLEDDYHNFSQAEDAIYKDHPKKGASELSRVPGITHGTIQAIEQHHMRVKGRGFPIRKPGSMVTFMAEIIGMCDELSRAHQLSVKKSDFDMITHFEAEVFPYFSFTSVRAFKKTFLPNKFPELH